MNGKSLTGTVVGLAVVVILAATLLMPALSDATTATKTITNEGATFALADEDDADTHTLVLTADDGGNIAITFDGESCEVPDFSTYSAATVIYSERSFVRLESSGTVYLYGANGSASYGRITLGDCLSAEITFTITGNTATVSTYTIPSLCAYISNEGTYVLALNPYVLSDTVVYAGAVTSFSGSAFGVVAFGALDDLTLTAVFPSGRTTDNPEITLTSICTNLKQLESITFDCYSGGGTTLLGSMTLNYLLAPKEITYESPTYVGEGGSALVSALPIVIIASLVVASVDVLATRRD